MDTGIGEDDSISNEVAAFYIEIRGLVVVFLFFVILFSIAHMMLQYVAAKPNPNVKQDRVDRLVHRLVLGVCTFTLTISLTGYSLLPCSIVVNELLLTYRHSYYLQWLDTDLVRGLALIVNMGTKIVCLLLPFSYFLLIAQGFQGITNTNSFGSRLLEAVCLLTFTFILFFGSVWSFGMFIRGLHTFFVGQSDLFSRIGFFSIHPVTWLVQSVQLHSWNAFLIRFVLHTTIKMLESIQLVFSLIGLLVLFACTPLGLLSLSLHLITSSYRTLPVIWTRTALCDQLTELHFDALCLEDGLKATALLCDTEPVWYDRTSVVHHTIELGDSTDPMGSLKLRMHSFLNKRRHIVDNKMRQLRYRLKHQLSSTLTDCIRPVLPCLVLALILGLLHLMQSFVFFNIINLVQNLFGLGNSDAGRSEASENTRLPLNDGGVAGEGSRAGNYALGHTPASSLGRVGAFLQICVIHFLLFVSLWGVYATPAARNLRPRKHALSVEAILTNVILLLLFTSALPLQSNLLGLTTLTVPNFLEFDYTRKGSKTNLQSQMSTTDHQCLASPSDCAPSSITRSIPPPEESSNSQPPFWHVFIPFSFSSSIPDSTSTSPPSPSKTQEPLTPPPPPRPSEKSFWTQFISRAFGASLSSSPSFGFIVAVLLYNLCFLFTSVWIAGRPLGDATRSFGLEIATSVRCLQSQLVSRNMANAALVDEEVRHDSIIVGHQD